MQEGKENKESETQIFTRGKSKYLNNWENTCTTERANMYSVCVCVCVCVQHVQ